MLRAEGRETLFTRLRDGYEELRIYVVVALITPLASSTDLNLDPYIPQYPSPLSATIEVDMLSEDCRNRSVEHETLTSTTNRYRDAMVTRI
ncbi:hypothetical protein CW709_02485 [Candidatus Bathyarchaeota archaeon]|nr:MAG: hypothetical protein CW709_02485 [Candidatus Bathyarchaeota archaeon]